MNQQQTLSHEAAMFVSRILAELEESADAPTYQRLLDENGEAGAFRWFDDIRTRADYQFELVRQGVGYQWQYRTSLRWAR